MTAGWNDSVNVSLIKADQLARPVETLHLKCHVRWAIFYDTSLGGSQGYQRLPISDIYLISLEIAMSWTTYSILCWKYPYPTL